MVNKDMKRYANLYHQITNIENCKYAILDAARGKMQRREVLEIVNNADKYAVLLSEVLEAQAYTPSDYRIITVCDGASKKIRVVQVPQFWPDQCVHHALMLVLEPIFMRRMYYWNCGSLPGRGIQHAQKGVERATLHDKRNAKYALKLDVVHCYNTMPNDKLKAVFRRIIKDAQVLWMIDTIIDSCEGLPIGNYTSAWFANLYLTRLDWYIKQTLSVPHYVRYMDDMVLTGPNKKKLHKAVRAIITFARDELGLKLHDNWNVFKVRREGDGKRDRPIDFVSFCFCLGYTTLRKRNALAIMRQSRRIQKIIAEGKPVPHKMAAGFISRAGQLTHCNGKRLREKHVDVLPMKKLKEVVRNESKR